MLKSGPILPAYIWLFAITLQQTSTDAWTNNRSPITFRYQAPSCTTATCLQASIDRPINIDDNNKENEAEDLKRRNLFAQSAGTGLAALASSLGLNLVSPELAEAYTGGFDAAETRRIEVFEKVAPSVVFIDTFTEKRDVFTTNVMEVPLGTGSGFVWDEEGHIITNFHVVREAKFAQVAILTKNASGAAGTNKQLPRLTNLPSQNPFEAPAVTPTTDVLPYTSMRPSGSNSRSVYKAKVVGVDPSKDIAVLKVDAPKSELFPISVGSSKGIKVGQSALAIGNPFGLDHTLTAGIVSGLGREVRSPIGRPISNVIQSDCAINPGNSGGPLLDSSGKLIGMNTAIYSPSGASSGIGFAIPSDTVKFIADTLIRDGQVVRPVLGISYLESKQARALGIQNGVLVLDVPESSPAYKAGLRGTRRTESGLIELGDILSKVGDLVINSESDLFKALENYKPDDMINVTIKRVTVSEENAVTLASIDLNIRLQSSVDVERQMKLYQVPSIGVPPLPAPAQ